MVSLSNEHFEVSVNVTWAGPGEGIRYDFEFLWDGQPIVNDRVLKRVNDFWDERRPGGYFVTEYARDRPLAAIESALVLNAPARFESVDGGFAWSVFPCLPRMPQHPFGNERQGQHLDTAKSPLQAELFTFWFELDTFNFDREESLTGDGIGFYLLVERHQLEAFVSELSVERRAIIQQEGVFAEDW